MGPRKRVKPNPKPASNDAIHLATDSKPPEQKQTSQSENQDSKLPGDHNALKQATKEAEDSPRLQHARSWYSGNWGNGNKTFPVTQVAKESIHAAVDVTSDVVATARAHTPPAIAGSLRKSLARQSVDGSPLSKTPEDGSSHSIPQISHGASGSIDDHPEKNDTVRQEVVTASPAAMVVASKRATDAGEARPAGDDRNDIPTIDRATHDARSADDKSASWLSWFSRPEQTSAASTASQNAQSTTNNSMALSKEGHVVSNTVSEPSDIPQHVSQPTAVGDSQPSQTQIQDKRRSWLNLWPRPPQSSAPSLTEPTTDQDAMDVALPQAPPTASDKAKLVQAADATQSKGTPPRKQGQRRSSGWAFWSHNETNQSGIPHSSEQGELAVAGSPSQTHPEKDVVDKVKGVPVKIGKQQSTASEPARGPGDQPTDKVTEKPEKAVSGSKKSPAESKLQNLEGKAKASSSNLVLPEFRNTYDAISKPGLMQQLVRWFHLASLTDSTRHLEAVANPPRIRNALVIGVHGYFPTPLVRSFLGQPTGTSIRFANSAADAISHWTKAHGYTCEIEKVALEGEGKIAERIEILWGLLLNWIDKIRRADFVFVACHSQGCPVALTLVAKLISFGCVASARIEVCAMAGINHGPFTEYKTRWIGSTALELFEFGNEESIVSKEYQAALKIALDFGVKVLYIGSIDDQLVSLESSTFSAMSHPNIYRAVFIDGRVHVPDFLTHLVGFALKLRNLGVSDHGLIRELSSPLAGSLYSGEGHSRIYEDESVYYLAVQHALETTNGSGAQLHRQSDRGGGSQNPYILPFAMRGLLEEDYVRTELQGEIVDLIRQFDEWKPSSKALKDVKFRLEGVRSRL